MTRRPWLSLETFFCESLFIMNSSLFKKFRNVSLLFEQLSLVLLIRVSH